MKKNIDITDVRYNGNEVTALYKGGTLVYKKADDPTAYLLAGEYTEPGEYYYTIYYPYQEFPIELNDDLTFEVMIPEDINSITKLFDGHTKLKRVTHFPKTPNVTTASGVFRNCTSLTDVNLKGLDMSKNIAISSFCENCHSLTEINFPEFGMAHIDVISYAFAECHSLTSLDLSMFDTTLVKNYTMTFCNCTSLVNLKLNFNMQNAVRSDYDFLGCTSLVNITGTVKNIPVNISFKSSPLSNDSAMLLIDGLANVSDTKKITFSPETYDTLTSEQIALATSKGWSVVSA